MACMACLALSLSRGHKKGIPGVEREDGGLDVPGVTGVPAVHGVAKLIDGPIFDLPGTLKDIYYLVASFWQSQRRCTRYHTTLY